jgi:L-aminopeptidase/D-esterase-like protein
MKKDYIVTLNFQFPAWDTKNGIEFQIRADSKQQAIKYARSQAFNDGHTGSGQGRATFTAKETQSC